MTDSDDMNTIENLSSKVESLEENIKMLSSILEKFGFDVITKLGQNKSNLRVLIEKIDELSKATIDVKSLSPQLSNIIEGQSSLESEIDLIKTLIQKSNLASGSKDVIYNEVSRDISKTEWKKSITQEFNSLRSQLKDSNDIKLIINDLNKIKENLFELTGGHKILYEISQTIIKLSKEEEPLELSKRKIDEKIGFWINKLE